MTKFRRDDIIKEGAELGVVLQSGEISYDIVWIGGSTSRYRYSTRRHVRLATKFDLDGQDSVIRHLRLEAAAARDERRQGAGIKRGQIWPSH